MPGRNDWSAGFTKSAQRTKFIRKRDIKMKDSEMKKEQHICHAMCEGICRRCIEKAQWRFKYDKYKPLKNIGNCRTCKQKVVTKAYRNLCDPCALKRKVCPSCEVDMEEANRVIEVVAKPKKTSGGADKEGEEGDEDEEQEMGDAVMVQDDAPVGDAQQDGDGDEDEEGDEESEGEEEGDEEPDDEAEDMEEDI